MMISRYYIEDWRVT